MLFCSTEGGYEGAFQTTDNAIRLFENNAGLESWNSLGSPLATPDATSAMSSFPKALVTPESINFLPPDVATPGLDGGILQSLVPGGDLSSLVGSMSAMPGGTGLILSFFQFLGALFSSGLGMTATQLAQNYAMAAQAALGSAKLLKP